MHEIVLCQERTLKDHIVSARAPKARLLDGSFRNQRE